jgi:hypothetical protein
MLMAILMETFIFHLDRAERTEAQAKKQRLRFRSAAAADLR